MLSPQQKITGVRVLGALATGSIALYFLFFAYALVGSNESWSKLFVNYVLWFLYVPLMTGLVYFYARVQLGRWLLAAGDVEHALKWSDERRTYHFWLRGKREALVHRIVTATAHLRRVDYKEAERVLWQDEPLPRRAPELLELNVLRMIWAMREENMKLVRELEEQEFEFRTSAATRATRLSVMAERYARAGKVHDVKRLLDESRWVESTWYADFVEILAMSDTKERIFDAHLLEKRWDGVRDEVARHLPGALLELCIARAKVDMWRGDGERALEALREAMTLNGDKRSEGVWARARQHPELTGALERVEETMEEEE